jgi:hypothetical protein
MRRKKGRAMRKWGIVISVFYALVVIGLLVPAAIFMAGTPDPFRKVISADLIGTLTVWITWIPVAAVLVGQAVLLFLSVDTTQKRLRPRTHIAVSVVVSSLLFGLLSFAVILCVDAAIRGDKFGDKYLDYLGGPFGFWAILWVLWAVVFYIYFRNSAGFTRRAISWLLKGSALELLIVVPCHVIVRRRGGCCAPVVTSFGIVAGIAVMLLCFGPSVLFLFKKRLDAYSARKSA